MKLKDVLNGVIQNIWAKVGFMEDTLISEYKTLVKLIHAQEGSDLSTS
jgi:hypothetical protein